MQRGVFASVWWAAIAAILPLASVTAFSQSRGAPQQVLLVYPFDRLSAATVAIDQAMRSQMQENPGGVEFYTEFLDLVRFPTDEQQRITASLLRAKYRRRRLDLVITIYGMASDWVLKRRADLFPNVPLVFAEPEDSVRVGLPRDVSWLAVPVDPKRTIDFALRLQPATQHIYVVGGSSDADKRALARARIQLAGLERRLTITPLTGLPLAQLLRIVDTLPPQSILYVDSFREDVDGVHYRSHEAVSAIASVASAPIYSRNALLLGHGAVGGYVESLDSVGRATARLARRVLAGERPGRVAMAVAAYGYAVDQRQLRRWDLSRSRLPRGARILFEETSFWQRYRTEILVTVSVLLLQSALIVALVVGRTQRTHSMREIHELNEQLSLHARELRTLIDVAPVGIAIAHDRGCIRMTANEAFAKIVGSRAGSAAGEAAARGTAAGVSFFKGGVEILASELPMRRAAAYAVEVRAEEIDVRHADGTVLTLYASASPVFDAHGTIVGCVGAFLDITDRKRAELEAQEHQRELAHLSRVAALGELSGALAHELKQPLAAMLANTQAAQRFLARPRPNLSEVRTILADIAQDVRRASDVIGHTSAMIKKETAPWQRTDLNEVVRNVLDLTRRELTGRGVVASASLSAELPRVLGDGVQLQQVVLNLVMNACDAMEGVPREERRLRIATAANNGEVELSVMDQGIGIPEESVGRVFQPFFTSKQHGLGLGLSICRSIVNAHGGRLWVVNNPTGGATFHMSAPRAPNEDHLAPPELAHFDAASTQAEPAPQTL